MGCLVATVLLICLCPVLKAQTPTAQHDSTPVPINLSGRWRNTRDGNWILITQHGGDLTALLNAVGPCATMWQEKLEGAVQGDSIHLRGISARPLTVQKEGCRSGYSLDVFDGLISSDGARITGWFTDRAGR